MGFGIAGDWRFAWPGPPDQLDDLADAWRDEQVSADVLGPDEVLDIEPALNPSTVVGLHLPQKCQVRNPRHLKALLSATSAAGVELVSGSPVVEVVTENGHVTAVRTPDGEHSAGQFIVATGAWTRRVLAGVWSRGVDRTGPWPNCPTVGATAAVHSRDRVGGPVPGSSP